MHSPYRLGLLFPRRCGAARLFASGTGTGTGTDFSTTTGAALQPPQHLDERELAVFRKLSEALRPTRLEVPPPPPQILLAWLTEDQVQDVSDGCGSMYAIEIASEQFRGLNMVRQHRLVNSVLADEIRGWHGVRLTTATD